MAKRAVKRKDNAHGPLFALAIATLALIVNFWAWSLLSPLGSRLADEMVLSPTSLSFLLAVPVIVGAFGRIVLGAATDKFGGRMVFAIASLITMIPVVALAFLTEYPHIVSVAVLLGVGGATFAIGIPYISSWFPPEKRGLVLGLYSMGNAGTAASGFLTPRLDDIIGRQWTFLLVALMLLTMAIVFLVWARNAPGWKPPKGSALLRIAAAAKNRVTWDLSLIYIITFGAFVAFGVYLPVLLNVWYDLSVTDAAARAAGFILLATAARPVGGWLSDKIGGSNVVKASLFAVVILAGFVAVQPELYIHTTAAYLSLAFALGCCNGAVFALVGKLSAPGSIGSVTGIVGALGGIGGFVPPLLLGFTYERTNSYAFALGLLAVSALVALAYISMRFKTKTYSNRKLAV